jgi:2-succinyl-5-enolpyruvyl-6-hydroxy-3-cyclohexene-1-carboxylate synthase
MAGHGDIAAVNDEHGWSPEAQATFCATLVDEWVRCGLTDAVVCPGSRSTPMTLALAADDRVRTHVHHDERSGSFMALGLAAAAGRPVVVVTTSGTAVVQLHAAAVEADLAGVPLLLCTADRPPELRDVAAPQTVDQLHLFGRSLRFFTDPGVVDPSQAGTWRSLAARTWAEATTAWPGPVQLNLPFREPLVGERGPLPPGRGDGPWHARLRTARSTPVLDVDVAAARGIVVAGRGTGDPDAVVDLAARLGWPLLADASSGCAGPGAIDGFDPILRSAFADRARPDVVLRSGGMPASKVLAQWLDAVAPEEIVIAPEGWWPDPAHRAAVMIDDVPGVPEGHEPVAEWRQAWETTAALAAGAIDAVLADEPLSEPGVARHLTRSLPPGSALVVSSSMPVRDVEWFGVGRRGLRVLANRGANGIDGVVSTAVGVALSGVRTTLLIGDVAFLHDSNGLLRLADRDVDLTVVVLDNDGGGIFSFLPQRTDLPADRFERLFGTPHGLDLVALARAHGVEAHRVDTVEALDWKPGVRVQVVTTDRDANVALHDRLNAAVAGVVEA